MPSIKRSDLEYTDELYEHRRLIVDAGQSPLRIDKFLFDKLDGVSRTRIQNAIDIGCILVNESKIKSNYKIKPLDNISLVLPQDPSEIGTLQPENIPLDVVYEDQHLMVINKPPGLVVHPGVGNHSGTLANALLYYFENHPLPTMKGNRPERPS